MKINHLILSLMMTATPAAAAIASSDGQAATNAASEWLNIVYRGDYAESWDQLSPELKSIYTAETWSVHLTALRTGLGSPLQTEVGGYDPDVASSIQSASITLNTGGEYLNGSKTSGSITMIRGLSGWLVGSYAVTRESNQ